MCVALRVNSSEISGITNAESVRAGVPLRSIAASSARQFIMVASMPMVSPVGRDTPREETSTPRTMLPPPTTTATSIAELARRDQIVGDTVHGGLVDAEGLAAGEKFARELDHDATIDRLSHSESLPSSRAGDRHVPHTSGARRRKTVFRDYFLPLAAATSAAKSDSCFSIPSPRA